MKLGPRKPNISKSIKAKTTGKIKRQVKKSIDPTYGKKGVGYIKDPKKAVYNKVYNKTTYSVINPTKDTTKNKTKNNQSTNKEPLSQNKREENKNKKYGLNKFLIVFGAIGAIVGITEKNIPMFLFFLALAIFNVYKYKQRSIYGKSQR